MLAFLTRRFSETASGIRNLSPNNGFLGVQFGQTGDSPVPANYDGDGKADISVYRIENGYSYWYVLQSSNGQKVSLRFGAAGDIPAVGIIPQ